VCKQAPNSCKAPCDTGDGYYCWGFGWALISVMGSPPRFADARNAFAKGCKLGVVTSCDWIEQVDREEKAYRDEVESLWFDVRNAANEVAHKHYLYTFATTKLSQTPQNVKGAANIQAHLKIIIAEQFCPAKKSFLLKSTEGDYSARAKQHCKDNPPVGAGLGGTQVTLTTECNGAFATTCP
jgi:hypothetical protein